MPNEMSIKTDVILRATQELPNQLKLIECTLKSLEKRHADLVSLLQPKEEDGQPGAG